MLALDSSVLVAALIASAPHHDACRHLLLSGKHAVHTHAFTETFSTLTGGRLGFRISTSDASSLLRDQLAPKTKPISLTEKALLRAYADAESRGVRGGAIYDYLHLVAAKKAGAEKLMTLNLYDFLSFHRPGDPEIIHP
ncbi:PIN domain-containing protein [Haloferula sp.]|uniref:PIN domain-containing protein n=1 Tax=Haloferula sp. TaxID=2497595 RepID=UPI003C753094